MKEVFRSKVGLELAVPIFLILGSTFAFMLILRDWPAVIGISCVTAFVLHLFTTTRYTISGSSLNVKSGVIINRTIDIGTITRITPTRSILSSPALSLDRLEIFYNKYDSIMISPNDKAGFIAQLKKINPQILSN